MPSQMPVSRTQIGCAITAQLISLSFTQFLSSADAHRPQQLARGLFKTYTQRVARCRAAVAGQGCVSGIEVQSVRVWCHLPISVFGVQVEHDKR